MRVCGYNVLPIITQRRTMKDDHLKKIAEEQFDHSHKKAFELVGLLFKDGNNGLTIQTILMTGAVMSASMNEMSKPMFLDGCSKLYDAYKGFADGVDELAEKIKKS